MKCVQYFLVRHCTNAIHVEKNVCENVVKTILGDKDTIASRHDMRTTGVCEELWLVKTTNARGKTKVIKPVAPYVLNDAELSIFMSRLAAIQVPTWYCGAIAKHITTKKLSGKLSSVSVVRRAQSRDCRAENFEFAR